MDGSHVGDLCFYYSHAICNLDGLDYLQAWANVSLLTMHTHLRADQYYNQGTILSILKLLLDPPHNRRYPMSLRFWRQDFSQNFPALYSLYMDQTMNSIKNCSPSQ